MLPWGPSFLTAHELPLVAFVLVGLLWIVAEYLARRSTWLQGAPKRPSSSMDHGTYPFIALGLAVSMVFSTVAFAFGLGGYLPLWTLPIGVVLAVLGLSIRGWALRTLGRFFTMPITIAEDHQIVRRGPYRWIRHPSYTGGFLTALAMPLLLGSWPGLLVTLAACSAVYVYRIGREEAALVGRFGDAYREYAATTSRLIPGVY
jgi:protein-S-isoprenylcysteine O-methyltransferase Ste14